MDRRRFLGATAGLAATALWPGWLKHAFGERDLPPDPDPRSPGLASAYRRAQSLGKPLLVLIIPQDNADRYHRGRAFGELINHGGDAALATLALCEVVCAPMSEVLSFTTLHGNAEPLMVLLETDEPSPRARMIDAALADRADFAGRRAQDWEATQRAEETAIEQRIQTLTQLLHRALLPDSGALERRALQSRNRLEASEIAAVERATLEGRDLRIALVDRAAALVALAAKQREAAHEPMYVALLARAAAARLRNQPPPGAYWAVASGCGTTVEGREELSRMFACGMGHVPAKSQRFLYFYTQAEG
jgi:hypothetical protein